jgi:peptidoglycan-associated lipoprotein
MKGFLAVLIALTVCLCGCAPQKVALTEPVQQQGVTSPDAQPGAGPGTGKERGIIEEELARARAREQEKERQRQEAMRLSPLKDVHFDFDSYTVVSAELPGLKEIAEWMKRFRDIRIIVEGHCDERGTADYNFALGQKRAEVVKEYLVKSGVEEGRIKTISFGKEMPAETGHSEESWARNRRAHPRIDEKG